MMASSPASAKKTTAGAFFPWCIILKKAMPGMHTYCILNFMYIVHMKITLKLKINMLREYFVLFIYPQKPSAGLINLVRLSL
jgi:hypothetical protein